MDAAGTGPEPRPPIPSWPWGGAGHLLLPLRVARWDLALNTNTPSYVTHVTYTNISSVNYMRRWSYIHSWGHSVSVQYDWDCLSWKNRRNKVYDNRSAGKRTFTFKLYDFSDCTIYSGLHCPHLERDLTDGLIVNTQLIQLCDINLKSLLHETHVIHSELTFTAIVHMWMVQNQVCHVPTKYWELWCKVIWLIVRTTPFASHTCPQRANEVTWKLTQHDCKL